MKDQSASDTGLPGARMDSSDALRLCKAWFEDIAEKMSNVTTGNVAHTRESIRRLALKCAECVDDFLALDDKRK